MSFWTSLHHLQGSKVLRFAELEEVYPFWLEDLVGVELTPLTEFCIICCHLFLWISVAWNLYPESDCTSDNLLLSHQHALLHIYVNSNAIEYCFCVSLQSWRAVMQKCLRQWLAHSYTLQHMGEFSLPSGQKSNQDLPEDERLQIIGIQPNKNPSGLLFWAIIMNYHVSPFSSQVGKRIAIVITVVRIWRTPNMKTNCEFISSLYFLDALE